MLSVQNLFEDSEYCDFQDMEQHFEDRTNYHISLVNKYLDKIIAAKDPRIDLATIQQEKRDHDDSKFEDPEHEPYIYITWKYFMRDKGIDYNPGTEIEKEMQLATFHHVKNNRHHPEAWDENSTIESINSKDRDKPGQVIDATKMPLTYVAIMVADWCAVSEERGTDPYKWAKININKRWKFTEEQQKFIYDLLDKIWR